MNAEELFPGLRCVVKYSLPPREAKVFMPFLEQPRTTADVAEILQYNKTTLSAVIQILRLKGLLILKDRDKKGNNIFEVNPDVFI